MKTDLRFALRQLLKSPGFTLLALLTLALGIGLNTAIFSLINDLFLRDLPFKEPGRVVHMYSNAKERKLLELAISAPRFQHYRDAQTIFDGFGAENVFAFTLTGLGDPVQIFGGKVTPNYFDVLGVRPIRGRKFLAEADGRRSKCDRPEHHARWRVAHNRRYLAESALFLDRTERRSLDDKT